MPISASQPRQPRDAPLGCGTQTADENCSTVATAAAADLGSRLSAIPTRSEGQRRMRRGPELEIGHTAIARRLNTHVIIWSFKLEKAIMLQTVSWLLSGASAISHYCCRYAFGQSLRRRSCITSSATIHGRQVLPQPQSTSITPTISKITSSIDVLGDEGNNTPFFFIPVFLVGACPYLVLPADLFVVQAVTCAA